MEDAQTLLTMEDMQTSLAKDVYANLRADILSMKIAPGTPLNERKIAEAFGLSRTPVREALQRLEREELVRLYHRRGIIVTELTLQDALEDFVIREWIEPQAARIAAIKMESGTLTQLIQLFQSLESEPTSPESLSMHCKFDDILHRKIIEAAGNNRLTSLVTRMNSVSQRVRAKGTPLRWKESLGEHREVLDALQRKDGTAAEQAMKAHLVAARQRLTQAG
jgi:DNA-binding GntR family transcriptional regulator